MNQRRPHGRLAIALALFASLCVVYSLFYPKRDWNSASRLLLSYALVQQHSVEISDFVSVDGKLLEHPQTRDLSRPRDGHYFCDKAPGHSFLGAIPAWIGIKILGLPAHPLATPVLRTWSTDRFITWGTNGVATALTAVLIYLTLTSFGVGYARSAACGIFYGVSTIALPNAVMFYGHSSSALFTMATAWMLIPETIEPRKCILAGLFAGCAVVCEYTLLVLPVAVIVGLARSALRDNANKHGWKNLYAFILGGAAPAAFLMWYHHRVTGSAFLFPYQFEVEQIFDYHKAGIPLGTPDFAAIGELLWGSKRGICWYSPILLLAIPGAILLFVRRHFFALIVCLFTFVGLLIEIAGFPSWHGGWCTGPRFLLPAFPLLFVPIGLWLARGFASESRFATMTKLGFAILLSVAGTVIVTACLIIGPQIPQNIENPIVKLVYPAMKLSPRIRVLEAPEHWDENDHPHFGEYLQAKAGIKTENRFSGFAIILALMLALVSLPLLLARRIEKQQRLQ